MDGSIRVAKTKTLISFAVTEADLRLCFRLSILLVFLCSGIFNHLSIEVLFCATLSVSEFGCFTLVQFIFFVCMCACNHVFFCVCSTVQVSSAVL